MKALADAFKSLDLVRSGHRLWPVVVARTLAALPFNMIRRCWEKATQMCLS